MTIHWHLGYRNKTACEIVCAPDKNGIAFAGDDSQVNCSSIIEQVTCTTCRQAMMKENHDIAIITVVPHGYMPLWSILKKTEKAVLASHHNEELWISKKHVRKVMNGSYYAAFWAIKQAQEYNRKNKGQKNDRTSGSSPTH